MFRALRILVLLVILVGVAGGTWLTRLRTTSWEQPLRVAVFPINADGSAATAAYVAKLDLASFAPVAAFLRGEAARYALPLTAPVEMFLAPEVDRVPPPPPYGGNVIQVMLWSLQMRFWAWKHGEFDSARPHVRIFVLYHDPERVSKVGHSLGLQKGLIGVVNAFATPAQEDQNNVILAHELLHTVGATDKYDPVDGRPRHPEGYAEPTRDPLLPQEFAELMGGRVPVSPERSEIPDSLDQVVIGIATAREINWIE